MKTSLLAAGNALNGDAWGLHDARLLELRIDYRTGTVELDLALMTSERQDRSRRARFTILGLSFVTIEPPHPQGGAGPSWVRAGERIDVHEVAGDSVEYARSALPPMPAGAWCCRIFDEGLNTFLWLAAQDARGVWLGDDEPCQRAVLFPGDVIPGALR